MNKRAVWASAASLLAIGSAYAGPVFVGHTTLTDSYGNTTGGEFLATTSGLTIGPRSLGEVAGAFETFCLEKFEDASFSVEFSADLNDRTVADPANPNYAGGMHGGFVDPISNETAYLYEHFILGDLTGYHYAHGTAAEKSARASDADLVQLAIWAFEDEVPAPGAGVNAFYDLAKAQVIAGYVNKAVFALNLYQQFPTNRHEIQDVLVMVPLPTASVAGMGLLAGLGVIRRRRA